MILIMGILSDPVMAYLCARLGEIGHEFLVLDSRGFRCEFDLTWSGGTEGITGQLRYGDRNIDLRRVRSLYVHSLALGDAPPNVYLQDQYDVGLANNWGLTAFANSAPILVVNRPCDSSSNASKTYQQQIIEANGLRTPRTLITTVPEQILPFYEECKGKVIYKSLSYVRSIVQVLDKEALTRLEEVRHCPTQFQEQVPGVDIRVHAVGERLFPTEILTEATDYRYASMQGAARRMRPTTLPPEIAQRCIDLAKALNMVFCGIDLRRTLDGEYYCFEVNPTPGFTFFQRYTGQRIGDALVDLLHSGNPVARH